jgi:hypothetical protein
VLPLFIGPAACTKDTIDALALMVAIAMANTNSVFDQVVFEEYYLYVAGKAIECN